MNRHSWQFFEHSETPTVFGFTAPGMVGTYVATVEETDAPDASLRIVLNRFRGRGTGPESLGQWDTQADGLWSKLERVKREAKRIDKEDQSKLERERSSV